MLQFHRTSISDNSAASYVAHKIGDSERRQNGSVWQMISPKMAKVFGRFGGIGSLQRSTPRWVEKTLVSRAAEFVRGLR
jgi:hypothetical protein